ncbi:uncharacterized protein CMC5_059370 [Chondromyces crocatus]|uniref:Uncharacterized protein n=1 Tax=Chondromyces crocatus TaxID=52 RepID=A0A0K1ELN4_CHOCO|nr:uncharacterized protein CMC5_059370 [Chondromyces crocatus]
MDRGAGEPSGHSVQVDRGAGEPSGRSVQLDRGASEPSGHSVQLDRGASEPSGRSVQVDRGASEPSGCSVQLDRGASEPSGRSVQLDRGAGKPSGRSVLQRRGVCALVSSSMAESMTWPLPAPGTPWRRPPEGWSSCAPCRPSPSTGRKAPARSRWKLRWRSSGFLTRSSKGRRGPRRPRFYEVAPNMTEVVKRVDAEPRLTEFWSRSFPFDERWG